MSILLLDNHPFIVVCVHGDSLGSSTNWFSAFFEIAQVGEQLDTPWRQGALDFYPLKDAHADKKNRPRAI